MIGRMTNGPFAGKGISRRDFRRAQQQGSLMSDPDNKYRGIDGRKTMDEEDQAKKDEEQWGKDVVEGLRLIRRFEDAFAKTSSQTRALIRDDIAKNRMQPYLVRIYQVVAAATGIAVPAAAAKTGQAVLNRHQWQDRHVARYAAMCERIDSVSSKSTKTIRLWPSQKRVSLQLKFWEPPHFDKTGEQRLVVIATAVYVMRSMPGGRAYLDSLQIEGS